MSQNGKGSANRTRKHQQFRENHDDVDWDKKKQDIKRKNKARSRTCPYCGDTDDNCDCTIPR